MYSQLTSPSEVFTCTQMVWEQRRVYNQVTSPSEVFTCTQMVWEQRSVQLGDKS